MERAGYIFLSIVAIAWLIAILTGLVLAWPYGVVGLVGIIGIGLLLIKVLTDRMKNKEDDYYSDNVDK